MLQRLRIARLLAEQTLVCFVLALPGDLRVDEMNSTAHLSALTLAMNPGLENRTEVEEFRRFIFTIHIRTAARIARLQ